MFLKIVGLSVYSTASLYETGSEVKNTRSLASFSQRLLSALSEKKSAVDVQVNDTKPI